ncbi:MAG TPA: metalloregulator ArsR/SmtB family transcription factor [Alphaproteobacteria bacterium]|nr:metalloregulator ArsR/SmtB family transcription factor [Alphaproteobacteria bacterium]
MTDQLSAAFSALADPTRRAILARLALGEASVGELAEPFDISLPAISRHLKVLEKARLIARERDAQWRRCRIEPEGLKAAADWVEQYRKFWEERLDALADFLETKKQATNQETKGSKDGKQRDRGTRRRD